MIRVAYGTVPSPLGDLLVACSLRGVVRIGMPGEDADVVLRVLSDSGFRLERSPGRLEQPQRELDEYFAGSRQAFALAIDLCAPRGFRLRALEAMRTIPYGETISYGELASRAGTAGAARAAGQACATNPIPVVVPCHRVIGSDGSLHGYAGGLEYKRWLLAHEGVHVESS